MFETLRPMPMRPKRRWLTLSFSAAAHVAVLVVIVSIGLFAHAEQAAPTSIPAFVMPVNTPPPAPAGQPHPTLSRPTPVAPTPMASPVQPLTLTNPDTITMDAPPPPSASLPVSAGVANGVPGGVVGGTGSAAAFGPPPPAAPVRIGGGLQAPALVKKVAPVYPPLAKAARIPGSVVVEAQVARTGEVESVHVVKSDGQFDEAAVNAVRQWRYKPLLLNGEPTPFILDVTVSFTTG